MKVLIYDTTQAFLTPGGKTIHAIKLKEEISKLGIDVEFARWWDQWQSDFDILHVLSYSDTAIINHARGREKKIICTMIMDHSTNESHLKQRIKQFFNYIIEFAPQRIKMHFPWTCLHNIDRVVFMHEQDRNCAIKLYPKQIFKQKSLIIPHAYDPSDLFMNHGLKPHESLPEKYLISIANIHERKQSILLARYAKKAKVPVVFIGSGNPRERYYQEFIAEVDSEYVFYLGYVTACEKNVALARAAGFVLLSKGESGCIAVFEAASFNLPLLLSNLPWAWGYEEPTNIYYCNQRNSKIAIEQLREFYKRSGKLVSPPFKINTWVAIAQMYKDCYENVINV